MKYQIRLIVEEVEALDDCVTYYFGEVHGEDIEGLYDTKEEAVKRVKGHVDLIAGYNIAENDLVMEGYYDE